MSEHLVFDVETNDPGDFRTLEGLERVLCLVVADADSNSPPDVYHDDPGLPRTAALSFGVGRLRDAARLIGHNLLGFDLPVLEWWITNKGAWASAFLGRPWFDRRRVVDTQVLSSLAWPDLRARDATVKRLPDSLLGSHGLEAWGHRLGVFKQVSYKYRDDKFQALDQELIDYCAQDVEVNRVLYRYFQRAKLILPAQAVRLEHDFAATIHAQVALGVRLDVERLPVVAGELEADRLALEEQLAVMIEPFVDEYVTPVRQERRTRVTPFNPKSKQQIARHLIERRGWKPRSKTPTGLPQVDEKVLASLSYPEAKLLAEHARLTKALGYLVDGKAAWAKLVKPTGRLHGEVRHNGTVTGRCTHSRPNLGNVWRKGELGQRLRALFVAEPGWVLVGADASSLELRMLAHYLAEWDGGLYGRLIDGGDVHQHTADVLGVDRELAKRIMFATLYGAGDAKIGRIVGRAKEGKAIRERLLSGIQGLDRLSARCRAATDSPGHLEGLDGRRVPVDQPHAALNYLLQSAGAVVLKQTVVNMDRALAGPLWRQVLFVHDEVQAECRPSFVSEACDGMVEAISEAGQQLGVRVPLRGEAKVGATWAETH